MNRRRHGGSWKRLRDCQQGVVLVEFALMLPFLLMLLIGGTAIEEAVIVSRKVTAAVHTLANVTTQYTSVADEDLSLILSASTLVIEPYPTANAQLIVSELAITSDGTGTVVWSRALNATPRAVGSTVNISSSAASGSSSDSSSTSTTTTTYLIYGEVIYDYTPRIASAYISPIQFYNSLFMVPRRSTSIPLTTSSN